MGICYIVGAGDFTPVGLAPEAEDFVIAADGGFLALQRLGLSPGLLVGDMDSLPQAPEGVALVRFPTEKDDTDMSLAIEEGFQRGYRRFMLYGGSGSRADHFLANLQTMAHWARQGAEIRLVCPGYQVYALVDGAMALPARPPGTVVSVFCFGERAEGVSLQGLRYPLTKATLTEERPLGVSNEMGAGPAWVRVARGTLLVVVYDRPEGRWQGQGDNGCGKEPLQGKDSVPPI